jgi:Tol biopolymer transport system component
MATKLVSRLDVPPVVRSLAALTIVLGGMLVLGGCAMSGCGPVAETSWSPDDKGIAYMDDGALRIFDLETKQSRGLDIGPGMGLLPSWSPDGGAVAFYSAVFGKDANLSLRSIDLASGQVRTLASGIWPLPTRVSPDKVNTGQSPEDALKDAQEGTLAMLLYYGNIAWSPDSKRLACVAATDANHGSILLVDSATATATPIVEEGNAVGPVAWSPDGKRLAYVRGCGPPIEDPAKPGGCTHAAAELKTSALWAYDLTTGVRQQACDLPDDGIMPGTRLEWSADSSQIGFIIPDKHNDDRGIGCAVDAQPDAAIRQELLGITPIAAWSPGLTGVVFVEQREGGESVVIYRGIRPRTRKVLGEVPLPKAEPAQPGEEQQSSSSQSDNDFSLPQFSHDGRSIALRVGEKPDVRIAVFEIR